MNFLRSEIGELEVEVSTTETDELTTVNRESNSVLTASPLTPGPQLVIGAVSSGVAAEGNPSSLIQQSDTELVASSATDAASSLRLTLENVRNLGIKYATGTNGNGSLVQNGACNCGQCAACGGSGGSSAGGFNYYNDYQLSLIHI